MAASKMTKQIWLVCSFCTLGIAVLLFWQYRFFNEQVQILQEAKNKYEEHIVNHMFLSNYKTIKLKIHKRRYICLDCEK